MTSKFKAGDKVRYNGNHWYNFVSEGKTYTVSSQESTFGTEYFYITADDDGHGEASAYNEVYFELVEPQFNIGDLVRALDSETNYRKDEEFVITFVEVDSDGDVFVAGDKDVEPYESGAWYPEHFELVQKDFGLPKFKVGQKVRLTESAYGNGFDPSSVGEIVTIKEVGIKAYVARGNYGYRIEENEVHGNRMDGRYGGWNGEAAFEEYVEPVVEAKQPSFAVGDKVRTLAYYNGVAAGTEAYVEELKMGIYGTQFYRVAGVLFTEYELELVVEEPVIELMGFDFAAMEQFIAEQFAAEQEVQDEFSVEHFGGQTVIRMAGSFDAKRVAAILNAAYAD